MCVIIVHSVYCMVQLIRDHKHPTSTKLFHSEYVALPGRCRCLVHKLLFASEILPYCILTECLDYPKQLLELELSKTVEFKIIRGAIILATPQRYKSSKSDKQKCKTFNDSDAGFKSRNSGQMPMEQGKFCHQSLLIPSGHGQATFLGPFECIRVEASTLILYWSEPVL